MPKPAKNHIWKRQRTGKHAPEKTVSRTDPKLLTPKKSRTADAAALDAALSAHPLKPPGK